MLLLASQSVLKIVIFRDMIQYCWMQNCFGEMYYHHFQDQLYPLMYFQIFKSHLDEEPH